MSTRDIAGTYEIEVRLGSQEVCFLEFDLPESNEELQKAKIDSPVGEETFRGLLATIFSTAGDSASSRVIQIYDLMDQLASLRDTIEAGESASLKTKLENYGRDALTKACFGYLIFLLEHNSNAQIVKLLSALAKFLFTKKEALPKVVNAAKQVKEAPRWDRVVKQNVLIADEPTQDIDTNPLEEESVDDPEPIETEWTEEILDTDGLGDPDIDADLDESDIP